MKIKNFMMQHRNDFSAVLICEHCRSEQELYTGYHDEFYHGKVLPTITCASCKKDRNGNIPKTPNNDGSMSVNLDGNIIE